MGRSEGIVHVDIAQGGQLLRKSRIVLLLLGMESQVLEQQNLAGFGAQLFHVRPCAIGRHLDRLAQQFGQSGGRRFQAHFRIRLAFGTAEMARQNYSSAVFQRITYGWQRGANTLVAGNFLPARGQGDVKIDPDENGFVLQIQVANGDFGHLEFRC